MRFSRFLTAIFLVLFSILGMAGCRNNVEARPEEEKSSVTTSISEAASEPESATLSTPPPEYAEGTSLYKKYSILTEGFDRKFTDSRGVGCYVYEVNRPDLSYFHNDQPDTIRLTNITSLAGTFCILPIGADFHPILLLIMYPKEIVEQTGKLQVGEQIYSKEEMEPYLVYTDEENEIYQVQPLICGQPFTECWKQLIQYKADIKNSTDPELARWKDMNLMTEQHNRVLEAGTYFTENISDLIVPYDEALENDQ